jgi:hypothetical protein
MDTAMPALVQALGTKPQSLNLLKEPAFVQAMGTKPHSLNLKHKETCVGGGDVGGVEDALHEPV